MRIYLVIVVLIFLWYDQVDANGCGPRGKCTKKKCRFPCPAEKCPHPGYTCCYKKKSRPKSGCFPIDPHEKPGKCPVKVGPIRNCALCSSDKDCGSGPLKCCGKCCTAVPVVRCKNKKTGRVGECIQRRFCQPPQYIDTMARCPKPWHKTCVCCMKGKPPTPPPTTTTTRKPPTTTPPATKPGKCPVKTGPIRNCILCKRDSDCGTGPERCCGSCCTANLVFPRCKDRHGNVGECKFKQFCRVPPHTWKEYCKKPFEKCVCCYKRIITKPPTPPPTPPGNPGKCPPVPRPCFPPKCKKDADCGKVKKCCDSCCVDPLSCRKGNVEGLCVPVGECRHTPRPDIPCLNFFGKKCVCCVKDAPKPSCTVTWAGDRWTGMCLSKSECKRQHKVPCKKGNKQCPKPHICCFDKNNLPVDNACHNLGK